MTPTPELVPLAELVTFFNGGTPSKKAPGYFEGQTPWITGADISDRGSISPRSFITPEAIRNSATTLVSSGTVLLVTRTSVGKVAVADRDLCFSQDVTALTPDTTRLRADYLVHLLRTKSAYFAANARGATIKGITREVVAKVMVPLPPLADQARIAEVLDRADELRTKRREALTHLNSLTQSIFLDMFGDPRANPKGWPSCPLSTLIAPGDRINYGVVQPGDNEDDGVPLVRVGDLADGRVDRSSLKHISPTIEAQYGRSRLRGNEILVSCVGSIGVVALAGPDDVGSNIARAVARVPVEDENTRNFLAAYLQTEAVQDYFTNELRTVSQPTLNIKQIGETLALLPPPELRQEFTQRVKAVEKLKRAHRANRAELDALFASLQDRAFRGLL